MSGSWISMNWLHIEENNQQSSWDRIMDSRAGRYLGSHLILSPTQSRNLLYRICGGAMANVKVAKPISLFSTFVLMEFLLFISQIYLLWGDFPTGSVSLLDLYPINHLSSFSNCPSSHGRKRREACSDHPPCSRTIKITPQNGEDDFLSKRFEAKRSWEICPRLYSPVWFLGWEDPLEKGRATHSNILAWRIPGTV